MVEEQQAGATDGGNRGPGTAGKATVVEELWAGDGGAGQGR